MTFVPFGRPIPRCASATGTLGLIKVKHSMKLQASVLVLANCEYTYRLMNGSDDLVGIISACNAHHAPGIAQLSHLV